MVSSHSCNKNVQTAARLWYNNAGYISELADIYHLDAHADAICEMPGFGKKSWTNLWAAIQNRREIPAEQFIYALCIPLIGKDVSKYILAAVGSDEFFARVNNPRPKGHGLVTAQS